MTGGLKKPWPKPRLLFKEQSTMPLGSVVAATSAERWVLRSLSFDPVTAINDADSTISAYITDTSKRPWMQQRDNLSVQGNPCTASRSRYFFLCCARCRHSPIF